MAEALTASMAADLDLPDGYTVEWCAIDASGNNVSGVVINNVSLFGTMLGTGADGGPNLGPFMLVPGPNA